MSTETDLSPVFKAANSPARRRPAPQASAEYGGAPLQPNVAGKTPGYNCNDSGRSDRAISACPQTTAPFGAITTFMALSVCASSSPSWARSRGMRWLTMRSKGKRSRLAAISRMEGR